MSTLWTLERLQSLINTAEEGTRLEYKRSEKLVKSSRIDLCKLVAAFANSAGGVLIIGVDANNETITLDNGVNPTEWKAINRTEPELWLRQSFETSIRRPIPDIEIVPIPHPENPERRIYIIDVPQSYYAPHQLVVEKEKFEFHKRVGSMTRQMEEYEIRDVMNRQTGPALGLNVTLQNKSSKVNNGTTFIETRLEIRNNSISPAHHFIISFDIDKRLTLSGPDNKGIGAGEAEFQTEGKRIKADKILFKYVAGIPIFGSGGFPFSGVNALYETWHLQLQGKLDKPLPNSEVYIRWEIEAPNMVKRYGIEKFQLGPTTYETVENGLQIAITHQTLEKGLEVERAEFVAMNAQDTANSQELTD